MTLHAEKMIHSLGDSLRPVELTLEDGAALALAERGSYARYMEFCAIQQLIPHDDVVREIQRQEAAREHVVAAFEKFIKGTELNEYEQSHIEPSLVPLYKMFRAFKLSQVK